MHSISKHEGETLKMKKNKQGLSQLLYDEGISS